MKSFVFLAILLLTSSANNASPNITDYCPPNEVIYPCTCNEKLRTGIICDKEVTSKFLVRSFEVISRLPNEFNRHFDTISLDFKINNFNFSANFFSNITADTIHLRIIDRGKMRHFDRKAFDGPISQTVKMVKFEGLTRFDENPYKSEMCEGFFGSISSLTNLETLLFNDIDFAQIPYNAFRQDINKHTVQRKLKEITFNKFYLEKGHLGRIGSFAFYDLPAINVFDFTFVSIETIAANAFAMSEASNKTFMINLQNSELTNATLTPGSLNGTQRPVVVVLGDKYNGYCNLLFKKLDANVFKLFLDANDKNEVKVGNCVVNCDCDMYWLWKRKEQLKDRVTGIRCGQDHNYRQLWTLEKSDFDHCACTCT